MRDRLVAEAAAAASASAGFTGDSTPHPGDGEQGRPIVADGWYTDPGNPSLLRYWQAGTWTSHCHPRGTSGGWLSRRSAPVRVVVVGFGAVLAMFGALVTVSVYLGLLGFFGDSPREGGIAAPVVDSEPRRSDPTPETTAQTATTAATKISSDEAAIAAGMVALCQDGNYSNNRDLGKACSGGGGRTKWLASYGRCNDGTVIVMSTRPSCTKHGGFSAVLPGYTPERGPNDVAKCANGLYSDNTKLSATCSSNGGVAEWLAPYGRCVDGTVIKMSRSADCSGHGGFGLLEDPAFVPATPSTATSIPATTTTPPTEGEACLKPQERRGGLVCAVRTPRGPDGSVWFSAPFSTAEDKVGVLPAEEAAAVQIQDMGVQMKSVPSDVTSWGTTYWCSGVGLKNFSSSNDSYSMFDFQLLTPSGSMQSATIPLVRDSASLLSTGELASGGSVSGTVCFNVPRDTSGRFAVVYAPFSFTSNSRGLFYFDR